MEEQRPFDWRRRYGADAREAVQAHIRACRESSGYALNVGLERTLWYPFRHWDLSGVDLRGLNIDFSDFAFTTLTGANLSGLELGRVLLPSHMWGVNLSWANAWGRLICNVHGCNFMGANLRSATVVGAVVNCDFRFADLTDIDLRQADRFVGCRFDGSLAYEAFRDECSTRGVWIDPRRV